MFNSYKQCLKIGSLLSLLFLMACSNLNYTPTAETQLKRYDIRLEKPLAKNLDKSGPSLLIYPIQSSSLYNSTRIAYSLKQHEVAYYAKNEWADTPGRLLHPLIISSMENSGLFSAVVSTGSAAISDLGLDIELIDFIQIHEDGASNVQLNVRVQLLDLRKRIVLGTENFSMKEKADDTPYGAVLAGNIASNRLIPALQNFVKSSIQRLQ